jgi:hypothetical protein
MYLKELIEQLSAMHPDLVIEFGFRSPHSHRGSYEQLAFEPARNVSIGEMLDHATNAMGQTFEGYKGGEYKMGEYTDCWLAHYGCCGEELGPSLLAFMLGKTPTVWLPVWVSPEDV